MRWNEDHPIWVLIFLGICFLLALIPMITSNLWSTHIP